MVKIKYRTGEGIDYLAPTSYSEFRPDYVLNDEGDDLVIVGKTNVKELIQSNADCALSALLDKFLGPDYFKSALNNYNIVDTGQVHEVVYDDDLNLICSQIDDLIYLQKELGLPSTSSLQEIYNAYVLKYQKKEVKESEKDEKEIKQEN